MLLENLRRMNIDPRAVEAVFLSHIHADHTGGRLFRSVYSSGLLADGVVEQALIVDTPQGLIVVTGCAHPGIVRIAKTARRLTGKCIHLLMGGFHLMAADREEISEIIVRLQALGVEKVAPSHCTGEQAIAQFRRAWGKDFVEGGLGAVIEVGPH